MDDITDNNADSELVKRLLDTCRSGTTEEICSALMDLVDLADLADAGATSSISQLIPLLTHDEAVVRANAANALGMLGANSERPQLVGAALLNVVHDSDPLVRSDVLEALARLRYLPAVGPAAAILRSDADAMVRAEAAETLGDIGDGRAADALWHVLQHDKDEAVRGYCAGAPGLVGGPEYLPLLTERSVTEPSIRVKVEILSARYRLGDDGVLPELLGALSTADEDLATVLLNILDDISLRQKPVQLDADAAHFARALADIAQHIATLAPQANALAERLQQHQSASPPVEISAEPEGDEGER